MFELCGARGLKPTLRLLAVMFHMQAQRANTKVMLLLG
jgi:hypothetical protein